MPHFTESAYLLTGKRAGRTWPCRLNFLNRGSAVRVEFDWTVVMEREDAKGDVLGFYHTHPRGHTRPSRRDIRTMQAWCDCLGKPLLCILGIPEADNFEIFGYLFRNHRSRGRKIRLTAQGRNHITFKE